MRKKNPSSYRLSPEALEIIKSLAEALGLSQAAVIEVAVRKLSRQEEAVDQELAKTKQEDRNG